MDKLLADLTDQELLREYGATDFDNGDWRRTDAVIGELRRRQIDF